MPLANLVPTEGPPSQKREFMAQMISHVENLHRQGIIHGDIKLANFLYYNHKIWLCDFEESQRVGEEPHPSSATRIYSPPWRVREIMTMSKESPLSFEDDLCGLGLSIWELFTDIGFTKISMGLLRKRITSLKDIYR
jgi:serine/threonine protein kinase